VIALFNREVINRVVSLSAAAKNVLYDYKIFNLGIDLTIKLTVNLIYNGVFNKA